MKCLVLLAFILHQLRLVASFTKDDVSICECSPFDMEQFPWRLAAYIIQKENHKDIILPKNESWQRSYFGVITVPIDLPKTCELTLLFPVDNNYTYQVSWRFSENEQETFVTVLDPLEQDETPGNDSDHCVAPKALQSTHHM